MKPNRKNLVKALQTLVNVRNNLNGTNIRLAYYEEDDQIGIFGNTSVPMVADVRMVAECFFQNPYSVVNVEHSWGFIELYICDGTFKVGMSETNKYTLKTLGIE